MCTIRRSGAALWALAVFGLFLPAKEALARDEDECMLVWHRSVSSYLTQNRTKFPQDETSGVFAAACKLEAQGKVDDARVEAIMVGAQQLAKLDMNGCKLFLEGYAGSKDPDRICQEAKGGDEAGLRKLIASTLPPAPKRKGQ